MRGLSPRGRSIVGALLVVAMAIAFAGFAATNTVQANLPRESFYRGTLDDNDAYDRLYRDLSRDEAFSDQLADLFGGVDVSSDDVIATLEEIVDPDDLRSAVEDGIERLVEYIRGDGDLDLSLDITPFIGGIYDAVVNYAVDAIIALPSNETDTYEDFEAELQNLLALLAGEGEIPSGIPSYPIPEGKQLEVAMIIFEAAGIDPEDPADVAVAEVIAEAILQDDVDLAIRLATASLLDKLVQQSILALTDNEFVYRTGKGDETRYILEPPASVTEKLEGRLKVARQINGSAAWARPVLLAVAAFAAVGIALVFRTRRRVAARWLGAGLLASGVFAFVAWAVARGIARDRVIEVVARKASLLPPSFQQIVEDVVDEAASDLTPAIWWPALAVALVGLLVVGISFVLPAEKPAPTTPAP